MEKYEPKCPFRFICGQPCRFRTNKLFWAICAVFLGYSAWDFYVGGFDAVTVMFLLLAGVIVLWAVFDGFKKKGN